ncbi:MAG: secretin N-terminal domain-containing protein [Armatimonadota bacterium]
MASDDTRKVDVIQVHYIPLKKISDIIRNSMPEIKLPEDKKNDKNEDQPGGFLLVVGPSSMVAEARRIAEEMDEATKELMGSQKTAVYRVKYVSPYDLALTLQRLVPGINVGPAPQDGFELTGPEAVKTGDNGSQVTGSTNATANTTTNTDSSEESGDKGPLFIPGRTQSVMIVGPEDQVQKALELAASLDVKSPQIKIEAKVTSLTKDGEKKLGLDWNWDTINYEESVDFVSPPPMDNDGKVYEGFKPLTEASNRWWRNPINFGATLDALITSGDGQLLAAPSLLCLEGKPGVFFVGDEVTYIQRIEQTDNGQNIKTDTRQVGVQLRVVGDVADNYITLNLHPEVSVLRLVADQAGITLPIITRRFTDHVVRVKSGETLVIGGLIRDEEIDEINRVPILSDLPFFGKLFKHRDKTSNHSEVVMFITATIVND